MVHRSFISTLPASKNRFDNRKSIRNDIIVLRLIYLQSLPEELNRRNKSNQCFASSSLFEALSSHHRANAGSAQADQEEEWGFKRHPLPIFSISPILIECPTATITQSASLTSSNGMRSTPYSCFAISESAQGSQCRQTSSCRYTRHTFLFFPSPYHISCIPATKEKGPSLCDDKPAVLFLNQPAGSRGSLTDSA